MLVLTLLFAFNFLFSLINSKPYCSFMASLKHFGQFYDLFLRLGLFYGI